MAWTEPQTFTTGEVVTAAKLNTNVRDNLLAIGPHARVRKSGDTNVTSSITLVNATDMAVTMAASEVWFVEVICFYFGNGTGDIKWGWTVPSGATGIWGRIAYEQSGAIGADTQGGVSLGSTLTADGTGALAHLYASVVNSTTAGDLQLQFAQRVSDATTTTFRAGSILLAHRVG